MTAKAAAVIAEIGRAKVARLNLAGEIFGAEKLPATAC
jgi:hypothetical protein